MTAATRTGVCARQSCVRVGIRVDEDMQMVEGCHQLQGFGHQQAIAEYVAGHVTNADHADHIGLHVDAAFTEMTLHRYPGTTGRDAHLLVVVTRRAARGEGIAKPEVVLGGNAVGNVGKTRRTLVRGNHQIGIIAVVTQHVGGWNHLALAQVVGDIQQPADEDAIAGDGFGLNIVTRAGGRQPPRHEAALGPTGTMTAFFTCCALTRPSTSVR